MKASKGQNIMDLSIQHSGAFEASFDLALANDTSVTAEVESGSELVSVDVLDQEMVEYYVRHKVEPATS